MGSLSTKELSDLRDSIKSSYLKMEPFRKNRYETIEQYVGTHYSDRGSKKELPINLIRLFVDIFVRQLAANNPSALVTTKFEKLKPFAATLELGLNHLIGEIDLQETLHAGVKDSMFSTGIVKVGLNRSSVVEIGGVLHDVVQAFADPVELDNFVWDMTGHRWEDMSFMGDRYRVDLDLAKKELFPDSKNAIKLVASKKEMGEGERHSTSDLTNDNSGQDDEFRPKVELWDIWLPRDNKVITIAHNQLDGEILNEIEWEGPERGPYHILSMSDVPGSPMPLAPIANHRDLHELVNNTMRKVQRQMNRQKTLLGVMEEAGEDGERVIQASDGDVIKLTNPPDRVKELNIGGIDNNNMAAIIQWIELYKTMSGNLDSLGGLGPQAPTLGQERIIADSSNVQVADMGSRVTRWTARIVSDLAFYLFNDPLINLPLVKRVPGVEGVEIPVRLTAADREGDFLEYNFDIDPVSMTHKTPGGQLNKLFTVVQQVYLPLAQMFEAQGLKFDLLVFIREIGKYMDLPELAGMFVQADGQPIFGEEPVGGKHERTMPNETTRTHIRINRPGATNRDSAAAAVQAFLGAGTDKQKAVAGRPAS